MCDEGGGVWSPKTRSWLGNVEVCGGGHATLPVPYYLKAVVSAVGTKEEGDREITSSRESPPVRAKKPRKARTAFSDHQLNQLERSFERQKYLSVQDRMDLAAALNLTDTQVKTWYQNRR